MKEFLKLSNGVINITEISRIFKRTEGSVCLYYVRFKWRDTPVQVNDMDYEIIEKELLKYS